MSDKQQRSIFRKQPSFKPSEHALKQLKSAEDMSDNYKSLIEPQNLINMRNLFNDKIENLMENLHLERFEELTEITEINVVGEKYNNILVHVIKPKNLPDKAPAFVQAHGGYAVMLTAKHFNPWLREAAQNLNCVIFNVEYRLAPENKCPKGILDFVSVIQHVQNQDQKYNIDKDKIVIGGSSGGGYICYGACVYLSIKNLSHLVYLAILDVPMISDFQFTTDNNKMNVFEKASLKLMKDFWNLISVDGWEKQKDDPLLFPACASDEILQKFPNIILFTCEFDFNLKENELFNERLRKFNKLIDCCCFSGEAHGFYINAENPKRQEFNEEFQKAFDHYVHKKSVFIINGYLDYTKYVTMILNIFYGTSNVPINQIKIKSSGEFISHACAVVEKLKEQSIITDIKTSLDSKNNSPKIEITLVINEKQREDLIQMIDNQLPTKNLDKNLRKRRTSQLERAISSNKREYRNLLADTALLSKLVDNTFKFLDTDKSGQLDPDEMRHLVKQFNPAFTLDIAKYIEKFDVNKDGKLDKAEFNNLFKLVIEDLMYEKQ